MELDDDSQPTDDALQHDFVPGTRDLESFYEFFLVQCYSLSK